MPQYTVHTSSAFDPKLRQFVKDVSIVVDSTTGLIVRVYVRDEENERLLDTPVNGDVDLRGKFLMPGFVDAHTHIFLHSYE
jgi:imidazolonepropionase-like amidohydrolase